MRTLALVATLLCLVACRRAPEAAPAGSAQVLRIQFAPDVLCGALNEAGVIGTPWKQGAAGFGCSSNELQIGPPDPSIAASSTVWYEVRGTHANFATTIVLGGDVRVPEAGRAIQNKLIDLSKLLLRTLNMQMDEVLQTAIRTNLSMDQRIGAYLVRYTSQTVGKVQENRLTIQRAL